ncbi:hypothetical protein [Staphylococcus equorum]|uniref:Uncharacterized protein n=1 Tax=Staphylococcus equorum TaxID=246432 RepID=A0A9X4LC10_9STAP|nr:hypothetical protein [Staphylococcus equorum]MDG0860343.1 hypothetical protein [Staphylococcus equorum]
MKFRVYEKNTDSIKFFKSYLELNKYIEDKKEVLNIEHEPDDIGVYRLDDFQDAIEIAFCSDIELYFNDIEIDFESILNNYIKPYETIKSKNVICLISKDNKDMISNRKMNSIYNSKENLNEILRHWFVIIDYKNDKE